MTDPCRQKQQEKQSNANQYTKTFFNGEILNDGVLNLVLHGLHIQFLDNF